MKQAVMKTFGACKGLLFYREAFTEEIDRRRAKVAPPFGVCSPR